MTTLQDRLRKLCNGHPYARVPWPHRELHEAADAIDEMVALMERIAKHKPLYDYVNLDVNQPGSPYDRGRQAEALLLAGIVAPFLAKYKAGAE